MGFTSAIIGIASLIGAGVSAYGSYESSRAQQREAEYQADASRRNAEIANINAQNAEDEGREAKKTGYENAVRKRQEAAAIIGAQRAAGGASGAAVDSGSALDLNLDTAEKGEIDAFTLDEEGRRQDYGKRVEGWNYRQQAAGMNAQANAYQSQADSINPWLSAGGSLLTGVASAGSNFYMMGKGMKTPNWPNWSDGFTKSNFQWTKNKTASLLR